MIVHPNSQRSITAAIEHPSTSVSLSEDLPAVRTFARDLSRWDGVSTVKDLVGMRSSDLARRLEGKVGSYESFVKFITAEGFRLTDRAQQRFQVEREREATLGVKNELQNRNAFIKLLRSENVPVSHLLQYVDRREFREGPEVQVERARDLLLNQIESSKSTGGIPTQPA